jgi:hypothetical protein
MVTFPSSKDSPVSERWNLPFTGTGNEIEQKTASGKIQGRPFTIVSE